MGRRESALVVSLALLGCGGASGVVSTRRHVAPFTCTSYVGPRVLGTITDPRLSEISGLAVSRTHPHVFYVQNDSGEPHARFFAIDASGVVLAEHAVGETLPAFDLEEIAIGPGRDPTHDAIYLADIGDNDARNGRGGRSAIHVLRVDEPPAPPRGTAPTTTVLTPVDRFELRYPEGPIDCEAFFVEPHSGDLYLLGKVASGPAPIFVAHAPLSTTGANTLVRVGQMLSARDLGIGALLDWIGAQPDLDASRVVVTGGSYGGYMSLATAVHFGHRIAGAIDDVGISHFVTFLQNTESYRRDLRRVEYGDERDPAMREFLDRISPLTNAQRITKPLFVVQGRNDPRVPYTEAEQIVAKVRANGTPVWYLRAENEGHGFVRKENADFRFYAVVRFIETVLGVSAR